MQIPPVSFASFRDVSAALAAPALSLDGLSREGGAHESGRVRDSISGSEIARLGPPMRASARAMTRAMSRVLDSGGSIDLVASFARPWSRQLALSYARCAHEDSDQLVELSQQVFTDAAHARSRAAATESTVAVRALAQAIGSDRSPLIVQGFVALTHTLPLLLAGAWHALVMQAGAWQLLRRTPDARSSAIDELLRLASPARVVFRRAVTDVRIGTMSVAAGDEVLLALQEANRCPAQFHDADCFVADRFRADHVGADYRDADPSAAGRSAVDSSVAENAPSRVEGCRHVGLGRNPHMCAGGALVRAALDISTSALLDEFDLVTPAGPVTWLGGFAIDGITSLPVTLQRASDRTNGECECPA